MNGEGYAAITALMEKLAMEGVDRWFLTGIEEVLCKKLAKAHRESRAVSMLPLFGADETAKALSISKATVYNIIHRRRRRSKFEDSLISKSI